MNQSLLILADHQRPDARHVDLVDGIGLQAGLREERRQIEIGLGAMARSKRDITDPSLRK